MSMYIRDQNECDLSEIKKKKGEKVERIILLCQKKKREREIDST